MTAAEKYVAGVDLVVFLAVLAYVLIIAPKLGRLEETLGTLEAAVSATSPPREPTRATGTSTARVDRRMLELTAAARLVEGLGRDACSPLN